MTDTLLTNAVAFAGLVNLSDRSPSYVYVTLPSGTPVTIQGSGNAIYLSGILGYEGDIYYQYRGGGGAYTSYVYRVIGSDDGTLDTANGVAVGNQVEENSPIAVDTDYAYFVRTALDGTSPNLVSASRLIANAADSSFTTLASGAPLALAAWGGNAYWAANTPINIYRRDAGATAAAVAIAQNVSVTEMTVDETNLYWLSPSAVQYCSLPACAGGVQTLLSGVSGASQLRAHGRFLYWIATDSTTMTGSIHRVAKP